MIRPLSSEIRSHLRSGVAVSSLTQVVDELVLNGLDAGASCITVRVDIPAFRVQVTDNGSGVLLDDLKLLGERYSTSKLHSLSDLDRLNSYGYRGEALASIRDICGILEIVTRHKTSYKTYCKLFRSGKALEVVDSCFPRSNTGTTVTAHDIYSSLPVRRKLVSGVFDFERIRQRLASIALIHPGVSFTLFNDSTGQKCLQTHKCTSVCSSFSQLFGNLKAKSLRGVSSEHKCFKVSGHIGLELHHSKRLQFLYVNSRLLLKTRIHKLVNNILAKSLLLRRLQSELDPGEDGSQETTSPRRSSERYAVFVLNIICPVIEYDITLEPAKTLVEFEDWDGVLHTVQNCVESFLVREKFTQFSENPEDATANEVDSSQGSDFNDSQTDQIDLSSYEYQTLSITEVKYGRDIDTSNVRRSLHSLVVTRKTTQPELQQSAQIKSQRNSDDCELIEKKQNNSPSSGAEGLTSDDLFDQLNMNICSDEKACLTADKGSISVTEALKGNINQEESGGIAPDQLQKQNQCIGEGNRSTTISCNVRKFSESGFFTSPNPITLQLNNSRKRHLDNPLLRNNCKKNSPKVQKSTAVRSMVKCNSKGKNQIEQKDNFNNLSLDPDGQCVRSLVSHSDVLMSPSLPSTVELEPLSPASPVTSPCIDNTHEIEQTSNPDKSDLITVNENSLVLEGNDTSVGSLQQVGATEDGSHGSCLEPIADSTSGMPSTSSLLPLFLNHQTKSSNLGHYIHQESNLVSMRNNCECSVTGSLYGSDQEFSISSCRELCCDVINGASSNNKVSADAFCSLSDKETRAGETNTCASFVGTYSRGGDGLKTSGSCTQLDEKCRTLNCSSSENDIELQENMSMDSTVEVKRNSETQKQEMSLTASVVNSEMNSKPDGRVMDYVPGMNDALSNDECGANWECTFDAALGRKLFVNLRSGNTSFEDPGKERGDNACADHNASKEDDVMCTNRALLPCAPHLSFDCTPWLPRDERTRFGINTVEDREEKVDRNGRQVTEQASSVRLSCCRVTCGDVSAMLDKWENPVFSLQHGVEVMNLSKCSGGRDEVHSAIHPYRFTKDMFHRMEVINQVDNKFIICLVHSQAAADSDDHETNCDRAQDENGLLVLVDQHAAHERVRLEQLTKDLMTSESSQAGASSRIKSSSVSPPIELEFSSEELRLVKSFRGEMERIGVRFVIGSSDSEPRVIVHEIPSVFVDREVSEVRRRRPSVAVSIVKELIQEHIEHLTHTGGVAPNIPKTILRILSSQACHGAIKFGEPLGVQECRQLILDLSTCDLPFQCAHGRPSTIPLVDLKPLQKIIVRSEEHQLPKLKKLTQAIKQRLDLDTKLSINS